MEDTNKNACIKTIENYFGKVDFLEMKLKELTNRVDEMKKAQACAASDKNVEEVKKEAYNEAYLAMKNDSENKEQEAFNRGVEYGKKLLKNRLDEIDRTLLKKYAYLGKDNELFKLLEEIL